MASNADPRFLIGDKVVRIINGDVYKVVNGYPIHSTNFLKQRYITSHNICVEPIDCYDRGFPDERQILHELEFESILASLVQPVFRAAVTTDQPGHCSGKPPEYTTMQNVTTTAQNLVQQLTLQLNSHGDHVQLEAVGSELINVSFVRGF